MRLRIWRYEWQKLWGNRLFFLLLAFLLLLSGLVCARQEIRPPFGSARAEVELLLDAYRISPEQTEAAARARVALYDAYDQKVIMGEAPEDEALMPDDVREARASYLADNQFLRFVKNTRSYGAGIEKIIADSRTMYDSFLLSGRQETDFVVRYQVGVALTYTKLLSSCPELPVEPVYGWDDAMSRGSFVIFYLAALLVLGTLLLMPEKAGMISQIRTTRYGRWMTMACKLGVGAVSSTLLAVVFTLLNFVLIVSKTGLRGADLPLQCAFPTAPYAITVLEGFFLQLMIRIVIGITFVWLVLLLSFPTRRYVGALGLGGAVIALSYAMQMFGKTQPYHIFRHLNLLNVLDGSELLTRWSAFYLGNLCIDTGKLIFPLCIVGCGVLFVLACLLFTVRTPFLRWGSADSMVGRLWRRMLMLVDRIKCKLPTQKCSGKMGLHLLAWEGKKIWLQRLTPILLILLVLVEWQGIGERYAEDVTYRDAVYHKYMTQLQGEYSEDTLVKYQQEREALNNIVSRPLELQAQYEQGEISKEEWIEILRAANHASQELNTLDEVGEKLIYLRDINDSGLFPWVVYDTGFLLYLEDGMDAALAALIILLLAGVFVDEYASGFSALLHSTPRGRRATFTHKLLLGAGCAAILSLVLQGGRLYLLARNYDLPIWDAPAYSLFNQEMLSGSIRQVMLQVLVLRVVGMALLALLVMALSSVTRATLPTVVLSTLCVFVSRLLHLFEVARLDHFLPDCILYGLPLLQSDTASVATGVFALSVGVLLLCAARREKLFSSIGGRF